MATARWSGWSHICQMSSGLLHAVVSHAWIPISIRCRDCLLRVERGVVDLRTSVVSGATPWRSWGASPNVPRCCRHRLPHRPSSVVSIQWLAQCAAKAGVQRRTVMPISISSHCFMGAMRLRYDTHVLMFSSTASSGTHKVSVDQNRRASHGGHWSPLGYWKRVRHIPDWDS